MNNSLSNVQLDFQSIIEKFIENFLKTVNEITEGYVKDDSRIQDSSFSFTYSFTDQR